MSVTVVIVTRNTCALTCAAVQSVLDSQDDFIRTVVVVDNGSSDDTAAVLPRRFPALVYLRQERNLGFGCANNLGARAATGDYLLLLNSDARLQPESLGTAVAWMAAHPNCGITGAQLLNPDGSRQNSIANHPTLATELLNKSLLRRLFPARYPGKEQTFAGPVPVESVIGAFMLIRRAAWEAVGGFDEDFFFFFEETHLCCQVQRAGWQVYHLPLVHVWHDQGGSAREMPAPARIEYWRSRYLYFRKHYGLSVRAVLAAGLLLRVALSLPGSLLGQLADRRHRRDWPARRRVLLAILRWHLRGRPLAMGLPR